MKNNEFMVSFVVLFAIIIAVIVITIIMNSGDVPKESSMGGWSRVKVDGGWIYSKYQFGAAFVPDSNIKLENDNAIKD